MMDTFSLETLDDYLAHTISSAYFSVCWEKYGWHFEVNNATSANSLSKIYRENNIGSIA